ncbi:hypothetical protein CCMA1212_007429 [Trichoderma ghanense]|uniref:Uncharacterized protein n=1 Tax=Trichoderma ghanense TaxID=65468 RepID=A0ABY2GZ20_9HYPO
MNTIIHGFIPAARRVLQNGNFSVNNILSIPHLTKDKGRTGPVIYNRVYHNESSDSASAVYVSSATNITHYATARKFALEHRHMIPVCSWDHDIPPHVLSMAEQTTILLLNSFIRPYGRDGDPVQIFVQRIWLLRRTFEGLRPRWMGTCYEAQGPEPRSPDCLLWGGRAIDRIRMQQFPQSAQTFTQYRTPLRFWKSLAGINGDQPFFPRPIESFGPFWTRFRVKWDSCKEFLVFEVRCPAVGPFEDFMQVTIGKSWCPVQALKGVVYLGDPPCEGFYNRFTFSSCKRVRQLKTCHPTQTYQWLQRLEISQPSPKMATWQQNFTLMTYIPSKSIGGRQDFNKIIPWMRFLLFLKVKRFKFGYSIHSKCFFTLRKHLQALFAVQPALLLHKTAMTCLNFRDPTLHC